MGAIVVRMIGAILRRRSMQDCLLRRTAGAGRARAIGHGCRNAMNPGRSPREKRRSGGRPRSRQKGLGDSQQDRALPSRPATSRTGHSSGPAPLSRPTLASCSCPHRRRARPRRHRPRRRRRRRVRRHRARRRSRSLRDHHRRQRRRCRRHPPPWPPPPSLSPPQTHTAVAEKKRGPARGSGEPHTRLQRELALECCF